MKNLFFCFAICLTASLVLSCSASRKSEPIQGKTFVIDDAKTKHGQELFMQHCQKCHPGGEAGLGPAINWNPAPGFIKKFQVRHGLGVMPAFKENEISRSDLDDISAYLKALRKF